jgi:hypothetical protein
MKCSHLILLHSLPNMHDYKLLKHSHCMFIAYILNGAVTMSLSLFPIQAASTLGMENSKQITSQLPYLQ